VNVDAIVFWVVWNAEKAILEVASFAEAIALSARTALRESIKERGAMVIVPSSVVETMGLGGMLGTAALNANMGGDTTKPR
jgi:hypothetical protein